MTSTPPRPWRTEFAATLKLAWPLVATNLAQALVGATDVAMLGRLGSDTLAAATLGLNLYLVFLIFGMGLTTAAVPMIARERGARPHAVRDIRRTVRQTIWVAATLCIPSWIVLWNAEPILVHLLDQNPALAHEAARFVRAVMWGMLPSLCFLVLRAFVAALEKPAWSLVVMVGLLVVNAGLNWLLIFGHAGLPALGLLGSGMASSIANSLSFVAMAAVIVYARPFRRYRLLGRFWRADWPRYRAVWTLGLPIAITLGFESTVFIAAVFLMGLLGTVPLAAHAIAIQIASVTFMVPLGIAQAATVRVGLASGRGDRAGIGRAGWVAFAIGEGFMVLTAALLVLAPQLLIGIILDVDAPANAPVVALAISLLAVAAVFQVVDGAQVIGAGMLRGLGDTKVPMLFAAIGYWGIGIGVGAWLAFARGWGGVGIWTGLATGLAVVSVLMIARWQARERLGLG
ncbi:MATE family efflux transporter [Sphingomonas sp. OK281]|uniref:MATE family efflux transporter n=1 Tax=Sphingomonas sp. OK281 TaxID=1881067 RepID=UPI0008EF4A3D|nr:MATE family efflux transporter [Sphingomonas sp. OK281]SFO28013.1 multidrug resistance protein, MATE family [Sphingomonas sp. OK281]